MDDRRSRINKLSERFKSSQGRPKQTRRERERKSYYLDNQIAERLDQSYKDLNHQIYPNTVSKSVFIESIFEYGMNNLDAVKRIIQSNSETKEPST